MHASLKSYDTAAQDAQKVKLAVGERISKMETQFLESGAPIVSWGMFGILTAACCEAFFLREFCPLDGVKFCTHECHSI